MRVPRWNESCGSFHQQTGTVAAETSLLDQAEANWKGKSLPRTISKLSWAVVHLLTFGAPFVDGRRSIQHHQCRAAWWPHPAGKEQHSTVWWD